MELPSAWECCSLFTYSMIHVFQWHEEGENKDELMVNRCDMTQSTVSLLLCAAAMVEGKVLVKEVLPVGEIQSR